MNLVLLIIAGVCLSTMISLNGELSNYLNIFEVSLIVHVIGAVLIILYIKIIKKEKIKWLGIPPYLYIAGALGVLLVTLNSYCSNKIGVALTVSVSVAGQVIISSIIDHFGLFQVRIVRFSWRRLPAFIAICIGLLLMINS